MGIERKSIFFVKEIKLKITRDECFRDYMQRSHTHTIPDIRLLMFLSTTHVFRVVRVT